MPRRIQMSRQHPWRAEHPNAVIVARPSKWGNPFPVSVYGLDLSIALFRNTALGIWNPGLLAAETDEHLAKTYQAHHDWMHRIGFHPTEIIRYELRGRDLACWCPLDQACHGDVLLSIAVGEEI